jgi:hypothetical protein
MLSAMALRLNSSGPSGWPGNGLVDELRRLNPEGDSCRVGGVRVWGMRPGLSVTVTAADRRRLAAIAGDRNSPQKHVWRAEIVLLTADGVGTVEIMRRTGKAKTCVWRWQERFAQEGVDGLWRDKTLPARLL